MLEKLLLVLVGVVISSAGYFVKRMIEKRSQTDSLDRQQKILAITKSMKEQGLSIDDMKHLEAVLAGRAEAIAKRTADLEGEAKSLVERKNGQFLSQAELSIRADANLKVAKAKVDQVLAELSMKLDDVERAAMNEAQN